MNKLQISLHLLICSLLTSCASNHHLVFFTNTTIGVEIGSEPANGSPAKFIIGYKRQEGVIDPLVPDYNFVVNSGVNKAPNGTLDNLEKPQNGDTNIILTPQGTAIPEGASNRAHSVLAKMNFGATGGGNGASAAQFFATGRAADYLAQSNNIAGALAGESSINSTTANLEALGTANFSYVHDVYRILKEYINKNGAKSGEALNIKISVDKLDTGQFKKTFEEYSLGAVASSYNINDFAISSNTEFRNVLSHVGAMITSLDLAKKMIIDATAKNNGALLSAAQKQNIIDNVAKYPIQIKTAKDSLSNNKSIIAMIKFVHEDILLDTTK